MRLYSNVLMSSDVFAATACVEDVYADEVTTHGSRTHDRAISFYLEGLGERHTRSRNQRDGKAATWDDYGVVIAYLFDIDPDAIIGGYKGRDAFMEETARWSGENVAPWTAQGYDARNVRWPDEQQKAADAARLNRRKAREIKQQIKVLERKLAALTVTA